MKLCKLSKSCHKQHLTKDGFDVSIQRALVHQEEGMVQQISGRWLGQDVAEILIMIDV